MSKRAAACNDIVARKVRSETIQTTPDNAKGVKAFVCVIPVADRPDGNCAGNDESCLNQPVAKWACASWGIERYYCEDCQEKELGGWPEGVDRPSMSKPPNKKAAEDASSERPSSILEDGGRVEEGEEKWELAEIHSEEVIAEAPILCGANSDDPCPKSLRACVHYKELNLKSKEEWHGCLYCQDALFDGWPHDIAMIPVKNLSESHKQVMTEYCWPKPGDKDKDVMDTNGCHVPPEFPDFAKLYPDLACKTPSRKKAKAAAPALIPFRPPQPKDYKGKKAMVTPLPRPPAFVAKEFFNDFGIAEPCISSLQVQQKCQAFLGSLLREMDADSKVRNLVSIGTCFQDIIDHRLEEEKRLAATKSPLLDLPTAILGKVIHFLDEEALLKLENCIKACWSENDRTVFLSHWEALDKMQACYPKYTKICPAGITHMKKISSSSEELQGAECARFRGIHFAQAAAFARRMERSAKLHYGEEDKKPAASNKKATLGNEWPENGWSGYDTRVLAADFGDVWWNHHSRTEACLFVRISLRNETTGEDEVCFQSFQPAVNDDDPNLQSENQHFLLHSLGGEMGSPMMKLFFPDQASFGREVLGIQEGENGKEIWPDAAVKKVASKLSLAIVSCTCDDQKPEKMIPKFVLATSGCEETSGCNEDGDGVVGFNDRNVNRYDFISTALYRTNVCSKNGPHWVLQMFWKDPDSDEMDAYRMDADDF